MQHVVDSSIALRDYKPNALNPVASHSGKQAVPEEFQASALKQKLARVQLIVKELELQRQQQQQHKQGNKVSVPQLQPQPPRQQHQPSKLQHSRRLQALKSRTVAASADPVNKQPPATSSRSLQAGPGARARARSLSPAPTSVRVPVCRRAASPHSGTTGTHARNSRTRAAPTLGRQSPVPAVTVFNAQQALHMAVSTCQHHQSQSQDQPGQCRYGQQQVAAHNIQEVQPAAPPGTPRVAQGASGPGSLPATNTYGAIAISITDTYCATAAAQLQHQHGVQAAMDGAGHAAAGKGLVLQQAASQHRQHTSAEAASTTNRASEESATSDCLTLQDRAPAALSLAKQQAQQHYLQLKTQSNALHAAAADAIRQVQLGHDAGRGPHNLEQQQQQGQQLPPGASDLSKITEKSCNLPKECQDTQTCNGLQQQLDQLLSVSHKSPRGWWKVKEYQQQLQHLHATLCEREQQLKQLFNHLVLEKQSHSRQISHHQQEHKKQLQHVLEHVTLMQDEISQQAQQLQEQLQQAEQAEEKEAQLRHIIAELQKEKQAMEAELAGHVNTVELLETQKEVLHLRCESIAAEGQQVQEQLSAARAGQSELQLQCMKLKKRIQQAQDEKEGLLAHNMQLQEQQQLLLHAHRNLQQQDIKKQQELQEVALQKCQVELKEQALRECQQQLQDAKAVLQAEVDHQHNHIKSMIQQLQQQEQLMIADVRAVKALYTKDLKVEAQRTQEVTRQLKDISGKHEIISAKLAQLQRDHARVLDRKLESDRRILALQHKLKQVKCKLPDDNGVREEVATADVTHAKGRQQRQRKPQETPTAAAELQGPVLAVKREQNTEQGRTSTVATGTSAMPADTTLQEQLDHQCTEEVIDYQGPESRVKPSSAVSLAKQRNTAAAAILKEQPAPVTEQQTQARSTAQRRLHMEFKEILNQSARTAIGRTQSAAGCPVTTNTAAMQQLSSATNPMLAASCAPVGSSSSRQSMTTTQRSAASSAGDITSMQGLHEVLPSHQQLQQWQSDHMRWQRMQHLRARQAQAPSATEACRVSQVGEGQTGRNSNSAGQLLRQTSLPLQPSGQLKLRTQQTEDQHVPEQHKQKPCTNAALPQCAPFPADKQPSMQKPQQQSKGRHSSGSSFAAGIGMRHLSCQSELQPAELCSGTVAAAPLAGKLPLQQGIGAIKLSSSSNRAGAPPHTTVYESSINPLWCSALEVQHMLSDDTCPESPTQQQQQPYNCFTNKLAEEGLLKSTGYMPALPVLVAYTPDTLSLRDDAAGISSPKECNSSGSRSRSSSDGSSIFITAEHSMQSAVLQSSDSRSSMQELPATATCLSKAGNEDMGTAAKSCSMFRDLHQQQQRAPGSNVSAFIAAIDHKAGTSATRCTQEVAAGALGNLVAAQDMSTRMAPTESVLFGKPWISTVLPHESEARLYHFGQVPRMMSVSDSSDLLAPTSAAGLHQAASPHGQRASAGRYQSPHGAASPVIAAGSSVYRTTGGARRKQDVIDVAVNLTGTCINLNVPSLVAQGAPAHRQS